MDYSMYRGDSLILDIEVKQGDVAVDLTDSKVWMTAKKNYTDADDKAVFQITTPDDIELTAPLLGKARIVVPAAETIGLTYPTGTLQTKLFYDIQVKTVTGIVQTVAVGQLIVNEDVTRAIA